MPTPWFFFAVGRLVARSSQSRAAMVGISTVDCYDPTADRWLPATGMRYGMARYDATVVERQMCVIEGWRWPFYASPRAGVYDMDWDTWEEMSEGMRDGRIEASTIVGDRRLIITNYKDG
uniref:F-box protein AFR-like n=1 Tax=Elaeis guineensis var. tenera TaxID=51953 RepID=A0A6J0PP27_ELAGV|nr:F-box protein AFR-like [Elaeis guineensis]